MRQDHPVNVLLVEDNPEDAELTLRTLRKSNFSNPVEVVEDGQEALDVLLRPGGFLDREGPRVILLDLKLPKVDGIEILRRLKADPRGRITPVVVLTSSQEESDLMASYELGASSFIVKPVDFEKFGESVTTIGMYWLLLNKAPA
jgi:CheY-like chemotaxis protein